MNFCLCCEGEDGFFIRRLGVGVALVHIILGLTIFKGYSNTNKERLVSTRPPSKHEVLSFNRIGWHLGI